MAAARAWLIRHGESESNAGLPGRGPAETPLTRLGFRQSELVARAVPEPPALIVTSPFVRARQTAHPTIARFPDSAVQEWPVQEFTYLGHLHGEVSTDRQRAPYARAYWQRADPHAVTGDAESFADLIGRTADCLGRLERQTDGLVTVFTHGTFIRALLWSLLSRTTIMTGEAMSRFRAFADTCVMPNGSIVELRFPGPRVLAGSTAHLLEATAETR
ncbi:histidine phosphatase family protein [Pseudonocardia acaciae]|uniref:histidine phosphatase family protein n=1 Tax=Pseudonocardia acaciae TaxID=551276 RepID=UPI000569B23F|nr:histidine phosphatase family protein [Pseudonocardia acaciae]